MELVLNNAEVKLNWNLDLIFLLLAVFAKIHLAPVGSLKIIEPYETNLTLNLQGKHTPFSWGG